ncbi:hypothetical protein Tco_1246114 [Tanacetum coccineum]
MGRDIIQLEDAVSTISAEYLQGFTSEFYIPESLHPELPGPEEPISEFPEGKNNRFFWVDERIFPTVMEWRTSVPKDKMPSADSYSTEDVATLNTHRTPIQKQPEDLLCLVGLSQNYFLGDDEYPTFLYDDDREMDLFDLISALNPTKVKIGTRPRASHEVPLLTATASRVINMEDTPAVSVSSETPSAMEKSLLDFSNEDSPQLITEGGETENQVPTAVSQEVLRAEDAATTKVAPEPDLEKKVTAMGPLVNKRSQKRDKGEAEVNAPPKVLRKDHDAARPVQNTRGGKSLAAMRVDAEPTFHIPMTQDTPAIVQSVSKPDPLSDVKPRQKTDREIAESS